MFFMLKYFLYLQIFNLENQIGKPTKKLFKNLYYEKKIIFRSYF